MVDTYSAAGNGESAPPRRVSAQAYLAALAPIMAKVSEQADGPVQQAADLIVASLRAGGVVQAFGSGHSEALAMEIAGRAGGLVPTNRIALRDVVIIGGESPEVLASKHLERDPSIAHRLYDLANVSAADIFVIASNSGVNGSIVELAQVVKQHGHRLIAITSFTQTAGVDSRHPSGKKLVDLADVALDNGAPYGDSVLPLPGGRHRLRGLVDHRRPGRAADRRRSRPAADRGGRDAAGLPVGQRPRRGRAQQQPRSPLRRPDPSYGLTLLQHTEPGRQTP